MSVHGFNGAARRPPLLSLYLVSLAAIFGACSGGSHPAAKVTSSSVPPSGVNGSGGVSVSEARRVGALGSDGVVVDAPADVNMTGGTATVVFRVTAPASLGATSVEVHLEGDCVASIAGGGSPKIVPLGSDGSADVTVHASIADPGARDCNVSLAAAVPGRDDTGRDKTVAVHRRP